MRRHGFLPGGGLVSLLVAGFVGYLTGVWQAGGMNLAGVSAAQAVALRFPQEWTEQSAAAEISTSGDAGGPVLGTTQLALFDPAPMVPQARQSLRVASVQSAQPATAPPTTAEPVAPLARLAAADAARSGAPGAVVNSAKPAGTTERPLLNERPGFVLNDSQIASIKARLHLTMDQERMWPAVEAALRNVAYVRAQAAARRHGAPAATTQTASTDSVEVQGLKSAALPLLMSFSDEQKDEVRSLAHVMGLDQLASQL